jgi:hypothetical protein
MKPKPFQQLTTPAGDPGGDDLDSTSAGARGSTALREQSGGRRSREGLRRIWRFRQCAI